MFSCQGRIDCAALERQELSRLHFIQTRYGRDREETNVSYKRYETRKDFVNGIDGEYFYLFVYDADQQGGKWFYKRYSDTAWKRVSTALAKIKVEETA